MTNTIIVQPYEEYQRLGRARIKFYFFAITFFFGLMFIILDTNFGSSLTWLGFLLLLPTIIYLIFKVYKKSSWTRHNKKKLIIGIIVIAILVILYLSYASSIVNVIDNTFNKPEQIQPNVLSLVNKPTVEDMFACRPNCSDLFGLGTEGIATSVEVKSDNSRVIQCQCINRANKNQMVEYQVTI